jgi:thioredoxin-related protein
MNTKIYTLFIALFSFLSFAQTEIKPLSIGAIMPLQDQVLQNIDDKNTMLKDLMGEKGLIIIFSCNTCPFVVGGKNFEGWEKAYNGLHDIATKLGFNLVLLNSNEAKREQGDSMDDMKKRAAEMSYKMPYLYDKNSLVANAFGAKTTPHVFFFSKDYKLAYTGSIDNQMEQNKKRHTDYLINAMNVVSKGKKVKLSSTPPIGCSIKRVQQ